MSSFFYFDSAIFGILECTWNDEIVKKRYSTKNGTTALVNVHRRSCGLKHDPPELEFVHICKHSPCTAVWAPSSYGVMPVPLHVRRLEWTADLEAHLNGDRWLRSSPPLPPPYEPPPEHTDEACSISQPSLGIEGHRAKRHCAEVTVTVTVQNEEEAHKQKRRRITKKSASRSCGCA